MIGTDSNHCRIVADCLAGRREVDEHTSDALAALGEKLEHLRGLDSIFAGVEFSAHVEKLRSRKAPIAVG
ncbi:MAG: hypothetical protein JSW66_20070 [Phycisphaerales bacterium]|nr:MAG: hypothetical protein JSW66_20070 [Phycisphaerales bacterium]